MGHALRFGSDVFAFHAANEQRIGNERAVASPRHRLGTHQDQSLAFFRLRNQSIDRLLEFFRLHVIRVTAERPVPPTFVGRLLRRPAKPS